MRASCRKKAMFGDCLLNISCMPHLESLPLDHQTLYPTSDQLHLGQHAFKFGEI